MATPSPQQNVQPETLVMLDDPNTRITSLEEVIKCISKSMEAIKKVNEDIASRLPPWKEPGPKERCEAKCKGKIPVGQGDDESSVHGSHRTLVQNGKDSFHKGSYHEETHMQQSYGEESYHPRPHHSQFDSARNKKVEVDNKV